jgi:hypothetical protein
MPGISENTILLFCSERQDNAGLRYFRIPYGLIGRYVQENRSFNLGARCSLLVARWIVF